MTTIFKPYYYLSTLVILFLNSCLNNHDLNTTEKEQITTEINDMFKNYHQDIKNGGLTAEFKYLDTSSDFFWVPPGYENALDYNTVKDILEQHATQYKTVEFDWETIAIYPISQNLASYTGIVTGHMIDTTNTRTSIKIIESGTVIKRHNGWKLLNGQSANLESNH